MWSSAFLHVGATVGFFVGLILVATILRTSRPSSTSLAWVILVLLIPYLGIPLYLAFGTRKLSKLSLAKAQLRLSTSSRDTPSGPLGISRVLGSSGIPAATSGNHVAFHTSATSACDALIELIDGAEEEIALCTFILNADSTGRTVLAALERRARSGVRVFLLLDGVGSFRLRKSHLRPLLEAGGKVAWFIPVIHRPFRGRTNLRNHRKYAVADQRRVWAGGRNIAAEYFRADGTFPEWIDLTYSLVGPAAQQYYDLFTADWIFAAGKQPGSFVQERGSLASPGSRVRVVPSGPDLASDTLRDLLLTACFRAQSRILAVSPYFVPDAGLQDAFCLASRRGVRIDLILPEHSNHKLADIARESYLVELATAGVHIWLVPNAMVHAKAMVFDDALALAGSANLDCRSLLLNFEVMSAFETPKDIEALAGWLSELKLRSVPYAVRKRGVVREAVGAVVRLLAFQL